MFYAGRGDDDPQAELRRSRSTDGAAFAPSTLVHAPLTLETNRAVSQWVGDYVGAAVYEGDMLMVFTDNASSAPHVAFVRTPAELPLGSTEPDAGGALDGSLDGGCYANSTFTPLPWAPPTSFGQGACTAAQVQAYVSCTNAGSCASFRGDADEHRPRLGRLETDLAAPAHGPFVTQTGDAGVAIVEVNYGGCQAHFDGQDGATGCGAQFNANNDCFTQECEACSDFANPTQSGPTSACWGHRERGRSVLHAPADDLPAERSSTIRTARRPPARTRRASRLCGAVPEPPEPLLAGSATSHDPAPRSRATEVRP